MASTNRSVPLEPPREATSGNEPPGPSPTDASDGWLKERVSGILNARKSRVSDRLEAVADTVRRVGEPLRDAPFRLGAYADDAAHTIDRFASGLRERDLDQLTEDVRDFARRRPAAFVGVGLAAGLIASRFLKSSSERSSTRPSTAGRSPARQGKGGARPRVAAGTRESAGARTRHRRG